MIKNKILVLSSPGGHWVQLCRLFPSFDNCNVIYACTYIIPTEITNDKTYYKIEDISRDTITKLPSVISSILKIFKEEKPTHIITTGAMPGLIAIVLGRIYGCKTIWLDSIANSEKVSMSGRIAVFIAHNCFTQWERLSNKRIKYIGRVI